jgi:hypothetical protein
LLISFWSINKHGHNSNSCFRLVDF